MQEEVEASPGAGLDLRQINRKFLSNFVSLSVSGGFQEGRRGHSGQEDSAGGSAVSPAAGCPAGSAGLSAGPGTGIQLR